MDRDIKVYITNEIPQLDKKLSINAITASFNSYIDTLGEKINLTVLDGWKLTFNVLLQRTDTISLAKQLGKYPSEKECAIYMSVPIPDDSEALYGIREVQQAFLKTANEKYSYILPTDFNGYHNLEEYVLESFKQLIDTALAKPFTFYGKVIVLGNKTT